MLNISIIGMVMITTLDEFVEEPFVGKELNHEQSIMSVTERGKMRMAM